MAVKQFYHDIDLVKVGQLQNTRLQNVADATALAAITTPGVGQIIYQVDTDELKIYDGSAWDTVALSVEGDVVFRGTVDASTSLDTGPQAVAVSGNQYVVATAGTLTMTGVTFTPSAVAEVGDVILFTSTTTASVIQRNVVAASDTTAGIVELATTTETAAGSATTLAVTPAGLASAMQTNRYTRQYTATVTLVADTPLTVTHGLALVSKDAFVINVMDSTGSAISVDVDSTSADALTLTASVALTDAVVTVVGASSTEFAIA
jgi:hypothetical protein